MGTEVEKEARGAPQTRDVTKPHLRQFFECREIGKEPPLNQEGFWKKPVHGFKIKGKGE